MKKLLIFQENGIFFTSCLKNSIFVLSRSFRFFHFFVFSFPHVFVSSCFHLFLFSFPLFFHFLVFLFLQMFFLLITFVLLPRVLGENAFYSRSFFTLHFPLLLSRFLWGWRSSLPSCRALHWGSKHRPSPFVCLNNAVFSNYMISRKLMA